jgi:hypothetical protein
MDNNDTLIYNLSTVTSEDYPLQKIYTLNENKHIEVKFYASTYYEIERWQIKGIYKFFELLSVLSSLKKSAIVSGIGNKNTLKHSLKNSSTLKEPEGGNNWLCIEVDNKKLPVGINQFSEEGIEYFINNCLPVCFHNITYCSQFSNSAGLSNEDDDFTHISLDKDGKAKKTTVKDGLNVHLFFWLNQGVLNYQKKVWFEDYDDDVVDKKIFTPTMPIFTSEPKIEGIGIKSRITKRIGLVEKAKGAVTVPEDVLQISLQESNKISSKSTSFYELPNDQQKMEIIEELRNCAGLGRFENRSNWIALGNGLFKAGFSISDWKYLSWSSVSARDLKSNWKSFKSNKYKGGIETLLGFIRKDSPDYNFIAPLYSIPESVTLEVGQEEYTDILNQANSNLSRNLLFYYIVKMTAGGGKSYLAIKHLLKKGRRVHYFIPRHKLSKEFRRDIKRLHPELKVVIIYGRTYQSEDENEPTPCLDDRLIGDKRLVDVFPTRGISVYQHCCDWKDGQCQHFENCKYLKQFEDAQDADVVILTHNELIIPRKTELKLPKPDLLIIDESFNGIFKKITKIRKSRIDGYLYNLNKNLYDFDDEPKFNDEIAKGERKILKAVSDCCISTKPMIKELKENGITIEDLRSARSNASNKTTTYCEITGDMDQNEVNNIWRHLKARTNFFRLYDCLLKDFKQNKDYSSYIGQINHKGFNLCYNMKLENRYKNIPILIIDGQADRTIIEKSIGESFEFHEINVKRKAKITQAYTSAFSRNRLTKTTKYNDSNQHIQDLNKFIGIKANEVSKMLIVCYKAIKDELEIPSNCSYEYFGGNTTGTNDHKDVDLALIIGRNQPSIDGLENQARCLFGDDPKALRFLEVSEDGYNNLPTKYARYNMKGNGMNKIVKASYHPDERIDSILKQIQEHETIQVLSRLRDIREEGKEVIILSNLILPLEIDKLVTWSELKNYGAERLDEILDSIDWTNEVLPLAAPYIVTKFPQFFKTEISFSKYMNHQGNQLLNKYTLLSNTFIKECIFYLVMYRCGSTKKYTRALTKLSLDETKGKLEEIFGCPVKLKADKSKIALVKNSEKTTAINNLYALEELEPLLEKVVCF